MKAKKKAKAMFPEWILVPFLLLHSILEAILVFSIFLAITDMLFGKAAPGGVQIYGWEAALPPLLVITYFVIMYRYLGGTVAMRLGRRLQRARH